MESHLVGRRFWLACLLAAAVSVPGCSDETKPTPPVIPPLPPHSSPTACLRELRQAYVDRDITAYRGLFSSDFTFVFSPDDGGGPIPLSWGLDDEMESARHLFGSESVQRIELSWDFSEEINAEAELPNAVKVFAENVQLKVTVEITPGETMTLRTPPYTVTFYCRRLPGDPSGPGTPPWQIVQWVDSQVGVHLESPTELMTWGALKRHYR